MITTEEPETAKRPAPTGWKMNLSPEERARRAAQIAPHAHAGGLATLAKISPEQRKVYQSMGGKARTAKYWEAIRAMTPDAPETYRKERKKVEAITAELREKLLSAARNGEKVDVRTITAALKVHQDEIETLWRRERELEGGDSGRTRATQKNRVSLAHSCAGGEAAGGAAVDPAQLADR